MRRIDRFLLKFTICFGCVILAGMVLPADEAPGYRLDLKKVPELQNGGIVFAEGIANQTGHRFMLSNLEIVQPVGLALVAMKDEEPVEMVLGRDRWDETIKTAATEKGAAGFHLRTQGDIRITVKSKTSTPGEYLLIAWVGDPVKPKVPAMLVARGGAAGRPWIRYASIGAVVVVVAGAGLFWRRRKKSTAAAIVVAAILGTGAVVALSAQTPSGLAPTIVLPTGPTPSISTPVLDGGLFPRPPGPMERTWNQIHNPDSSWNRRMDRLGGELDRFGHASAPFQFANAAMGAGFSAYDFWNESQNFTGDDASYMPDINPDGQPALPVGCAMNEQTQACLRCYASAQDHLQGMMLLLERLRASHDSTKRLIDAAVSFGDSVGGIHAVSGLAWQVERRGIQAEFAHFLELYEDKRRGMMGSLRRALDEVSACEAQYFNNPDWFSRYGFIYYQFMDARYKH